MCSIPTMNVKKSPKYPSLIWFWNEGSDEECVDADSGTDDDDDDDAVVVVEVFISFLTSAAATKK